MTVTKVNSEDEKQIEEKVEEQLVEHPGRRNISLKNLVRWAVIGLPLLLLSAAALAGLGFFLFYIPLLGTIAAVLAVAAGVLILLIALFIR
ncbi:MAG: hypothetical protein EHM41_12275 [Chloroflexi bacterium]|nr:MAG: hypothetical protein EHM41_12275 [Chloroflexota bacterium]